jgi:hypothetical protein
MAALPGKLFGFHRAAQVPAAPALLGPPSEYVLGPRAVI